MDVLVLGFMLNFWGIYLLNEEFCFKIIILERREFNVFSGIFLCLLKLEYYLVVLCFLLCGKIIDLLFKFRYGWI